MENVIVENIIHDVIKKSTKLILYVNNDNYINIKKKMLL